MSTELLCTLGISTKRDDDQTIGKFGEGLVVAISRLVSLGAKVKIQFADECCDFEYKTSKVTGKQILYLKEKDLRKKNGSCCTIDGIQVTVSGLGELDEWWEPDQYSFLTEPNPLSVRYAYTSGTLGPKKLMFDQSSREIALGSYFYGVLQISTQCKVFSGGIYVGTLEQHNNLSLFRMVDLNPRYSLGIGRDRNVLDTHVTVASIHSACHQLLAAMVDKSATDCQGIRILRMIWNFLFDPLCCLGADRHYFFMFNDPLIRAACEVLPTIYGDPTSLIVISKTDPGINKMDHLETSTRVIKTPYDFSNYCGSALDEYCWKLQLQDQLTRLVQSTHPNTMEQLDQETPLWKWVIQHLLPLFTRPSRQLSIFAIVMTDEMCKQYPLVDKHFVHFDKSSGRLVCGAERLHPAIDEDHVAVFMTLAQEMNAAGKFIRSQVLWGALVSRLLSEQNPASQRKTVTQTNVFGKMPVIFESLTTKTGPVTPVATVQVPMGHVVMAKMKRRAVPIWKRSGMEAAMAKWKPATTLGATSSSATNPHDTAIEEHSRRQQEIMDCAQMELVTSTPMSLYIDANQREANCSYATPERVDHATKVLQRVSDFNVSLYGPKGDCFQRMGLFVCLEAGHVEAFEYNGRVCFNVELLQNVGLTDGFALVHVYNTLLHELAHVMTPGHDHDIVFAEQLQTLVTHAMGLMVATFSST